MDLETIRLLEEFFFAQAIESADQAISVGNIIAGTQLLFRLPPKTLNTIVWGRAIIYMTICHEYGDYFTIAFNTARAVRDAGFQTFLKEKRRSIEGEIRAQTRTIEICDRLIQSSAE